MIESCKVTIPSKPGLAPSWKPNCQGVGASNCKLLFENPRNSPMETEPIINKTILNSKIIVRYLSDNWFFILFKYLIN